MRGKHWIGLLLAAGLLGICLGTLFAGREENRQTAVDITFEEPTLQTLQALVQEYHREDAVFSVTLEDYIRCFNSLYESQNPSAYFPGSEDWSISDRSRGIHTDYPVMEFLFSEDPQIFSPPTVKAHTPMEERFLQELMINFDEHSYTHEGFQRYRLLCADTLRVFFQDMSQEAAQKLCDEILSTGNAHIFSSQEWYTHGALPYGIYYKGDVGVYSYDAIGDWRHFCVIPFTEERRKEFEEKGVVLYEME